MIVLGAKAPDVCQSNKFWQPAENGDPTYGKRKEKRRKGARESRAVESKDLFSRVAMTRYELAAIRAGQGRKKMKGRCVRASDRYILVCK